MLKNTKLEPTEIWSKTRNISNVKNYITNKNTRKNEPSRQRDLARYLPFLGGKTNGLCLLYLHLSPPSYTQSRRVYSSVRYKVRDVYN